LTPKVTDAMSDPKAARPLFPKGYVDYPGKSLAWKTVEKTLARVKHYWVPTTRPNSRPHAAPIWGVWIGGRAYFDGSPQTRHAGNLAENSHVVWHLESGEKPVIGAGHGIPGPELGVKGMKRLLCQGGLPARYGAMSCMSGGVSDWRRM
jgi:hypothetical protein